MDWIEIWAMLQIIVPINVIIIVLIIWLIKTVIDILKGR